MNIEERLRAEMHAATDHIVPDEISSLAAVRAHGRAARRRRLALLGGSATALTVVAAALVVPRLDDDGPRLVSDEPPITAPDTVSSTAATAPATTPATTPATPATNPTNRVQPTTPATTPSAAVSDEVLWPGPDQPLFDDAVAAARSFVEEFVGLDDPPLGEFRPDGPDAGAVDVHGVSEAGTARDDVVSTISVQRLDGHWFVTAADADDVQIETPAAHAEVASPVRVEGQGRGFEGTVVVEVRDAFAPAGETLGQKATMGAGCCEDLAPFNAVVELSPPGGPTGVIVAHTTSGIAAVESFTAIPVRFAATPGEPGQVTTLRVFFTEVVDGTPGELVEVERTVPHTTGVLRASLVALLDGPTDTERTAGLQTWFPLDAGGAVEAVDLDEGLATVTLSTRVAVNPAPPADEVIAQLNATVFQFDNVHTVRYSLDGSCDAFDAWLHRGCEFTRDADSTPVVFVCPEGGLDAVEELQAEVDAGHQPWRLSAPDVAAACTFGIPGTTVEPAGENTFRVTEQSTGQTVLVTVVQPLRTGPGGVWAVSSVEPDEGTAPPSLEGASTEAVMVPPTGCCDPGPFVLLTNVTAQHQPGFDRIVFELSSPVVNYHVRYVPLPVTQDPSDLPVVLQGDSALQISMGATGTDQTVIPARQTYSGPLRVAVGTGAVIELVQTGDFEAVLNWAVGLRGQPPFRVSTESNPSRLVIDVASQ